MLVKLMGFCPCTVAHENYFVAVAFTGCVNCFLNHLFCKSTLSKILVRHNIFDKTNGLAVVRQVRNDGAITGGNHLSIFYCAIIDDVPVIFDAVFPHGTRCFASKTFAFFIQLNIQLNERCNVIFCQFSDFHTRIIYPKPRTANRKKKRALNSSTLSASPVLSPSCSTFPVEPSAVHAFQTLQFARRL